MQLNEGDSINGQAQELKKELGGVQAEQIVITRSLQEQLAEIHRIKSALNELQAKAQEGDKDE